MAKKTTYWMGIPERPYTEEEIEWHRQEMYKAHVERWGFSPEEAKELTDDFVRLLRKQKKIDWEKADYSD